MALKLRIVQGRRLEVPEALRSRPFTAQEAAQYGVTRHHLRNRRMFRHLMRDVYASRDLDNNLWLWLDAARKVVPEEAVFTCQTAARIRDIPVPDDGLVHITVPSDTSRPRTRRLRSHRMSALPASDKVNGHKVTPPDHTFLTLAQHLGLVDVVIAGDHMVHRRLVAIAELRATMSASNRKGVRLAQRAAGLVRERVDSPMETRLRLLLVLAGLPEPMVNVDVRLRNGKIQFTPDLHYPEARIAIEYDGDLHRTKATKWRRDHEIRRKITNEGWQVFAFNADDIYQTSYATIHEIHQALLARGQPNTPADTHEGVWKHFERPAEDLELARLNEEEPDPWDQDDS